MRNAESNTTLVIVCGLPGSGKTTLARQLEASMPAFRMSADDWMTTLSINLHAEEPRARIEALQWQMTKRLLALGQSVIIEWGTWGRWERDLLRTEARALGSAVELHYLTAPNEELFRRIQQRNAEDPPIQWEAVVRWGNIFEPPTPEEIALFDRCSVVENDTGLVLHRLDHDSIEEQDRAEPERCMRPSGA